MENLVGLGNFNNDDDKLVNAICYVDDEEAKMIEEHTRPDGLVEAIMYVDDEKKYLITIIGYEIDNENIEYRTWEFIEGRQKAYDFIKDLLIAEPEDVGFVMDVMKSKVLLDSENFKYSDAPSVFVFMDMMRVSNKIIDESTFDIKDYYYEEEE